jgi:hypothetical protein
VPDIFTTELAELAVWQKVLLLSLSAIINFILILTVHGLILRFLKARSTRRKENSDD